MRAPPAVAFALCTLIWGTTWLAIKIGYEGLDAVWGASLRFLIAGVLMLPFVLMRDGLPRTRRAIVVIVFVGLILFGLDYGLIYWGEQRLSSGLTAVLFSTTPLFVALYAPALLPSERLAPRQLLGVLVAFAGVVAISWDDLQFGGARVGPIFAIAGSAAAAGLSSVVVRRWGRDIQPRVLTSWAMLVGAAALFVASQALGETPTLPQTDRAWLSLLYLVVAGSILSFLLYWQLLREWPASRAILITLLVPVVAVITGISAGESLTAMQWVGSAVVLVGVAASVRPAPAPVAAASAVPE